MKDKLESIWKEVTLAFLKVLFRHLAGGFENVRIASLHAKNGAQGLLNMKHEC